MKYLRTPARIILIGFMGAGKTTVGRLLADRLDWQFLDSDHYLQDKTGDSIAALFEKYGESGFRRMEAEAIAELQELNQAVIALGGGAVETESTRNLIREKPGNHVVFLNAPLNVLTARCESQPGAAVRPILQQRELLAARFKSRMAHYLRAHDTIDTAGSTAEDVVEQILDCLRERSATAAALTTNDPRKR